MISETSSAECSGEPKRRLTRPSQLGACPCQAATIGRRTLPANVRHRLAMLRVAMTNSSAVPRPTLRAVLPSPARNVCPIGAIRSIESCGTSATVLQVPRMNIATMIGVEIQTERAMVRDGSRHSPAMIAMYSNPENAPAASLVKMFSEYNDATGSAMSSGR